MHTAYDTFLRLWAGWVGGQGGWAGTWVVGWGYPNRHSHYLYSVSYHVFPSMLSTPRTTGSPCSPQYSSHVVIKTKAQAERKHEQNVVKDQNPSMKTKRRYCFGVLRYPSNKTRSVLFWSYPTEVKTAASIPSCTYL